MANSHSSLVGGSTAAVTLICSGSIDERRKCSSDHNRYAAEGTCLHTIMEQAVDRNLPDAQVMKAFEGALWADLLHEPDEIEAYGSNKITRELIENKIFPALERFDEIVPQEAEFELERKLSFASRPSPLADGEDFAIEDATSKGSGTADVLFQVWASDEAEGDPEICIRAGLIDYKFGEGYIVDPEDNDQFKFYLAAAIHEGALPVVDEYEAWVIQPAGKLSEDKYARKAVYTFDELVEFALDLRESVDGPRKYETGAHCKMCNGKLTCAAYKQLLSRVEKTDVEGLDSKQLAAELDFVDTLSDYITKVKEAALRNARNGVKLPGYRLEAGLGDRTWVDEKAAGPAMSRMGLAAKERQITKLISAPQALTKLKKQGVPAKQLTRFEARHVYRPERAERLVKTKPGEVDGDAFTKLAKAMEAS